MQPIAVFLVGLAIAIAAFSARACSRHETTVQSAARAWATEHGIDPVTVDCERDLEDDGYELCAITGRDGGTATARCASGSSMGNGCR